MNSSYDEQKNKLNMKTREYEIEEKLIRDWIKEAKAVANECRYQEQNDYFDIILKYILNNESLFIKFRDLYESNRTD